MDIYYGWILTVLDGIADIQLFKKKPLLEEST